MKKVGPSGWRVLGVLGVGLSIGLALAAASAFTRVERPAVGDIALVEETMRVETPPRLSMTQPPPYVLGSFTTTVRSVPLWQANDPVGAGARTEPAPVPTRLEIEAIGVSADVEPYGVDTSTGQMDVPDNVSDVAWYRYGPSPGEPGSAVMAAHVDLRGLGRGVFYHLERLEPGDVIAVGFDDGTEARFEVRARTRYLKEELPTEVLFSRHGRPMLTLVTCGGGFDSSVSSYDSNVVVYAWPHIASGRDQRLIGTA
jgi:hypothetical protein